MEQKKVLFYGAGQHAAIIYRHACKKSASYGEPTAFIDRDIYKQGHDLFGLPVISWEEAQQRYGDDFYIYVTGNEKAAPQIIGFLLESGVTQDRIINYEPVEKRLGCLAAEAFMSVRPVGNNVMFSNCNHTVDNLVYRCLHECAVNHKDADNSEVFRGIIEHIRENAKDAASESCSGYHEECTNRKTEFFFKNKKIRLLAFGGIGPCNFKCSYCTLAHKNYKYEELTYQTYPVLIKILNSLKAEHLIDEDTVVDVANGEFSISKAGNEFVQLASDYPMTILSNAYVFSPEAAEALSKSGIILCSVDAGTAESFKRIKGVDGFDRVSDNLRQYAKYGPVCLKYILLEDMNDTEEDLNGFFKLADEVATRVTLTRDYMDGNTRFSDKTLRMAARFIKHFRNAGKLSMNTTFVRSGEVERLNKFLEEI